MANSFELITKYLPQALDKYFYEDAKTAILEKGNKWVDVNFKEAGYVKIASLLLDGLSDYYRTQNLPGPTNPADYAAYAGNLGANNRDGFAIGGATVKWEIKQLQYLRGKQLRIDYLDDEETAGIVIGNAVEEFSRTKVIPEVDATRFARIAENASVSLGNLVVEANAIAANTIIGKFNDAFEWLTEHEVPEEEQVIFVSPAVMTLIRNTNELTKFLTQEDYRSEAGINFTVEKYGGRPIIVVPTNRFFTDILVGQNGYQASANSKAINFMVVSTKATVPVRKLEWNKIYGPELSGLAGFHGYLIDYLIYHDLIIPENKIPGIYVDVSNVAANTKVDVLAVDTVAGAATNAWNIRRYFTNPAGLRGQLVYIEHNASGTGYAKDGFVVGNKLTGTAGTDYKVATLGQDISESGTVTVHFALVDAAGNIIASTGATAVAVTQK